SAAARPACGRKALVKVSGKKRTEGRDSELGRERPRDSKEERKDFAANLGMDLRGSTPASPRARAAKPGPWVRKFAGPGAGDPRRAHHPISPKAYAERGRSRPFQ